LSQAWEQRWRKDERSWIIDSQGQNNT